MKSQNNGACSCLKIEAKRFPWAASFWKLSTIFLKIKSVAPEQHFHFWPLRSAKCWLIPRWRLMNGYWSFFNALHAHWTVYHLKRAVKKAGSKVLPWGNTFPSLHILLHIRSLIWPTDTILWNDVAVHSINRCKP